MRLRPGVGDHLVRLAGPLRPLVQQQWAAQVVAFNRRQVPTLHAQGQLEAFLFGATRANLATLRGDGRRIPAGRWPSSRAVYLRLPDDARLWLTGDDFVAPDHPAHSGAVLPAPGPRRGARPDLQAQAAGRWPVT